MNQSKVSLGLPDCDVIQVYLAVASVSRSAQVYLTMMSFRSI